MIRFSFQKIDQGEKLKKGVIYYNTIEINTIADLLHHRYTRTMTGACLGMV